jgi:hypothetical protein
MAPFSVIGPLGLAISILLSVNCYGQEKLYSLKGVVIDASTGLQLTHVSIKLNDISSGLSRNSISADNGTFRINEISGDEFILQMTAVGYKDTVLNVSFGKATLVNLGNIRMMSLVKPLRPVNVYAQKPLIEQNTENIIYNVEADPENTYLNAFEMLRKVPLITTDANDNIQLNGNNNFKIFINGKPSLIFSQHPQNILQSLQASSIQSIEVMTIPPARYQSEGAGGIININTFRSIVGGINGGANVRALELSGVQGSGDFTIGTKKFSASVSTNYRDNKLPLLNTQMTRYDRSFDQTLMQNNSDNRTSNSLNNGAEITFQPNDQNVFSAAVIRNTGSNNNLRQQHSVLYDEKTARNYEFNALNKFENSISSTDYAVDYTHIFKNNDERKFDISYKLSNSNGSSESWFMRESPNDVTTNGTNKYSDDQSDYYFQANYAQPFKQHLLELGVANTRSVSNSENGADNDTDNDNFGYRENIKAAYVSLKLKFNRWLLITAGSWEMANLHLKLYSGESQINTYSYWTPNITLSRQFKKNHLLKLGYSERVTRPDISYLDPFVNNTDAFNISYGNPMLKPTISHVFNFTYTKAIRKFFASVNASHQFTENSIQQVAHVGSDTISHTTYENIGQYSSTALSISLNAILLKTINVNINGAVSHLRYSEVSSVKNETHSGFTYNTGITTTIHLKKWGLAAYANYMSPLISVQGSTTTFITNNFTVSRRLLSNNNLTLSLSVSEPFVSKRVSISEFIDPLFSIFQRSEIVNRQLNFSLNYRFAKIKSK